MRFFTLTLTIIAVFLGWQISTADYGSKVNDFEYIRDYVVETNVSENSGLQRQTVVGENTDRESLDLWMTRFKLYSVNADEHINILSLARVRNDPAALDPGFYQYGGAWLYPLGIWYFALSKLGTIEVGSLAGMLAEPDRIDAVYFWGRMLVLFCVACAGLMLATTLRRLANDGAALAGLAIFLFAPATIMYSQLLKPHWFALVFVVIAVDQLVRAAFGRRPEWHHDAITGIAVGLTFGAANTYAPFTVIVWLALVLLWRRGAVPLRSLVAVPAIACGAWAITNPHVILHFDSFRAAAAVAGNWFSPELTLRSVQDFVWNSGFRGFGFAFLGSVLAAAAVLLIRPQHAAHRPLAFAVIAIVAFYAWLTASMADWGINSRYAPYLLVLGIILLASVRWRHTGKVMWAIAILTLVQSLPLMTAYADENDPANSTRLRMAALINDTIPAGESICVGARTAAPFETPPFEFTRYRVNVEPCRYSTRTERHQVERPAPEGLKVVARVTPRFFSPAYRLVFGHINPQITLYEPE